jgi:hypothetical protein
VLPDNLGRMSSYKIMAAKRIRMSTYGIVRLKVPLESALTENICGGREMLPKLEALDLNNLEGPWNEHLYNLFQ